MQQLLRLRGGTGVKLGEVTEVTTKQAFDLMLQEAGDKLVVVDFTAQCAYSIFTSYFYARACSNLDSSVCMHARACAHVFLSLLSAMKTCTVALKLLCMQEILHVHARSRFIACSQNSRVWALPTDSTDD